MDLDKGITKVEALNRCGSEIFAMIIDGENTLVSDPDRHHCEHALKSLDHLVVIDIFLTETAALGRRGLPRQCLCRDRRELRQHRAPGPTPTPSRAPARRGQARLVDHQPTRPAAWL